MLLLKIGGVERGIIHETFKFRYDNPVEKGGLMAMFISQHGGNVREAAQQLGIAPDELLDFSANINPLGVPGRLLEQIRARPELLMQYPDVEYQALHNAIADHHQVPVSWVQAGNGETELIFDLVNLLRPSRTLLVTPGFAEYGRALTIAGCDVVYYSLRESDGWCLDQGILEALHQGITCLFLCTPNNPTGLLPDEALLHRIADACQHLGITLVVDEAFLDFIPERQGFVPFLAQWPHVWVLRSLTKFYAIPGLRLGYALNSDAEKMAALRARRPPWSINAWAALAGEILLTDRDYQDATYRWLAQEQAWLWSSMSDIPGITTWRPTANYLFWRCDTAGEDIQQALLAKHILIRACANYPGLDSRYYRVAIKVRQDNQRLVTALRSIMCDTAFPG